MAEIINSKKSNQEGMSSNSPKENLFSSFGRGRKKKEFREEEPQWSVDEMVLRPSIRETLEEVANYCLHKDTLIEEWDLNKFLKGNSSVGINFYGEPGTGKSTCAEAITKRLGKKYIKVDYGDIRDSEWGATEKNLSDLFRFAEETGYPIIFDEADALLGKRSSGGGNSSSENQVKSHLLTLIDRSNVIIFYTTNFFENFDKAFFRRILYHINIPMPNKEELIALWKLHLGDKSNTTGNLTLDKIKKDSTNFSYEKIAEAGVGTLAGGDVKNITVKLCVKLAAKSISAISTDDVLIEIEKYKQSLAESKGSKFVSERQLSKDEVKELKDSGQITQQEYEEFVKGTK